MTILSQLNPSKMDPGGDACANAEFLLQILDEITESILMSAEACPKYVNYSSYFGTSC